ncbi:MAG: protease inhibitor I42 family protein [Dehalogenimonas sp.]
MKIKKYLAIGSILLICALIAVEFLYNPVHVSDGEIVVEESGLDTASVLHGGHLWADINIDVGDSFTVTLYAYGGAGMRWSISSIDHKVVQTESHKYISDVPWPSIGGPGKEVWIFKGIEPSTVTIEMTYGSVGLTGPPIANTLSIKVRIS